MKHKELKNLAKKIAKAEKTLQENTDPIIIEEAEREIINLSGRVNRLEDIMILDELIQKILEKT